MTLDDFEEEDDEWEPRKGRPSMRVKRPWKTEEQRMHEERKRIFVQHMLFLSARRRKKK